MTVIPISPARSIVRVPLDLILEDVVQLRALYSQESLEELSESISEEGMFFPVLVAPADGGKYELIMGSRRVRAEKLRKSKDIMAVVIDQRSPLDYILMALAENIHREDFDPFEEARGFLRLIKEYDLSVPEIAARIKKTRGYITKRLQLISLPEEVQSSIASGKLGIHHAPTLANLDTGDEQVHWARKAATEKLSPPELRKMMRHDAGDERRQYHKPGTITAGKVRARTELTVDWFEDVQAKLVIKRVNADERAALIKVLGKLEMTVRDLRNSLEKGHAEAKSPSYGNADTLRNANEVWPAGDVKKITAENRPSDDELARQLGRTVNAIRGMRSKVTASKKRHRVV